MSPDMDLLVRLVMATFIGGLIGLNRDLHGKPAGVRTHALVALGSALILVVSGYLPGVDGAHVADVQSRVIQGVITGVGFLGAGVILHSVNDKRVHGLTTAAAVWVAALFGAGCGTGAFKPVLVAFVLLIIVLTLGGKFEKAIHRRLHPRDDRTAPPDA